MFCPKCAGDKFAVINVFRNRARKRGKWIYSESDTRLVMCRNCGQRFFTETVIVAEIKFNEKTSKSYEKRLGTEEKYYLEEDESGNIK